MSPGRADGYLLRRGHSWPLRRVLIVVQVVSPVVWRRHDNSMFWPLSWASAMPDQFQRNYIDICNAKGQQIGTLVGEHRSHCSTFFSTHDILRFHRAMDASLAMYPALKARRHRLATPELKTR